MTELTHSLPGLLPFCGYLVIFSLLLFGLSVNAIRNRQRVQILLQHGDDRRLLAATRAQANFAEYVPTCLLLLLAIALTCRHTLWIHGLAFTLIIARLSHAYSMLVTELAEKPTYKARVFGMMLTFAVILIASGKLVYVCLFA